jgi:thiol-disulfide isomerase/thioredoxin
MRRGETLRDIIGLLFIFGTLFMGHGAWAESVVVRMEGLTCIGCQDKIAVAVEAMPKVQSARVSFPQQLMCLDTKGEFVPNAAELEQSLASLEKYKVISIKEETCPLNSGDAVPRRLWAETDGVIVALVSRSAEFEIEDHLVEDKFTVIDFGADWCGPCVIAERRFREYISEHADVAIRAVVLEGKTPAESFALPVARQHLSNVAGLPYFKVFGPDGELVYKGSQVEKAIRAMNKGRTR